MDITPDRWRYFGAYSREVFGREDDHLAALMTEGVAAGLPNIAVSADVGRLLMILTSMTRAELAIEVGTLGGYSGIWIARGLRPGGRLITIESEPLHAAFAREQFERAGVADRVELREGAALEVLGELASELAPGSVDVVFLDADKSEYPDYWLVLRPLISRGGVLLADNVCGGGTWWIDDIDHPSRQAADRLNHLLADDPEFEAVAVPLREGVLVARRMSMGL